jgi:3',5'-cyclic-AMP phosphodiesterase
MNSASQVGKPIRILQLSDFHLLEDARQTMMGINTEQSLLAVLDHVWRNHKAFDLVLLTGDMVQEPTNPTYHRLRNQLASHPALFHCLPGNHDSVTLIRQAFVDNHIVYQPQIFLEFWQIFCLDSAIPDDPGGYLAKDQIDLLEAGLADHPELHAMICFHHSPLPTGAKWLDTMMLSNRDDFFALIQRFPQVKAVVYGHIHQAMDVEMNGLRYLGCPSTSFQFKADSEDFALDYLPQGYRWLELYPDGSLHTEVVRLDSVPEGLDMTSGGY